AYNSGESGGRRRNLPHLVVVLATGPRPAVKDVGFLRDKKQLTSRYISFKSESPSVKGFLPPCIPEPWYTFFMVFFMVITIITIGGNILVIAAVIHSQHLMQGVTSSFICSLAGADLLIGLVVMPLTALQIVEGTWLFGRQICNFRYTVDVTSVTASVNSLCVIAIDRYIAVTAPLRYQYVLNRRRAILLVLIVWIMSTTISFFPINFGWYRSKSMDAQACYENPKCCSFLATKAYAVASAAVAFYLPATLMIFLTPGSFSCCFMGADNVHTKCGIIYIPLSTILSSQLAGCSGTRSKQKLKGTKNGENIQMMSRREQRALKTLSIIMGVFILCWLPFSVILPVQGFCRSCVSDGLFYICIWIGYINSMCNPILYSRSPEFIMAYKRLLCGEMSKRTPLLLSWPDVWKLCHSASEENCTCSDRKKKLFNKSNID
uniref:Beta-2 adrenergic receptor n=1 Tax=Eptatretus burgeri TaxID=7764 RepID=A0A8C4NBY8_EPTBU